PFIQLDHPPRSGPEWRMIHRIPLYPLLALLALPGRLPAKEHLLHQFKKIQLTSDFYCEGANFGDFNHDGKMDLVSGPFWYEGPDFKTRHEYYPATTYDPLGYSENFFAFTYDLNQDGWTDILIVGFPRKEPVWSETPTGN